MPTLSIIVIAYNMPSQLANTLYSLSTDYQQNVDHQDYEVIVVENQSPATLDTSILDRLTGSFRYTLRNDEGVSPVPAFNEGLKQAQGKLIGIIIDGARLVTPRVVEHALACHRMMDHPMVVVPGYHIGESEHEHYSKERLGEEQKLLQEINWKANGYKLFDDACFSVGNRNGYFHPLMECSALFVNRAALDSIGGGDESFNLAGGGSFNLHLYRSLGILPQQQLVILPGEGSFHQYHQGVTTSSSEDRDQALALFNEQLNSFWGGQYKALTREPIIFGNIPKQAQHFLQTCCEAGRRRYQRLGRSQQAPWADDMAEQEATQ